MKYSLRSSFARSTLALLGSIFLVTLLGVFVTHTDARSHCTGWPICIPGDSIGYLKFAHLGTVLLAAIVMILVWRKAWREQRGHASLLPLTTIAGVLFFGQVLIGSIQVNRAYPEHLVILHALTAVSLWISLI